jgi:hypothetical protein
VDFEGEGAMAQQPGTQAWTVIARKWLGRGVVIILAAGLILLLISRIYSITFLFGLIFGFQEQKDFFYQTLGLSDAWSTVLGRLMQFITALAWIPLLFFFPLNPLKPKKLAIFFLGFAVIYIANPLIKAVARTDVCFNQKTGEPIKWYVVENNGEITLYDSDGFDQNGVRKLPASTAICQIYQNQKKGFVPHLLQADPRTLTFFYANGSARVWYDRGANGEYRFFDAPGYDPNAGTKLLPVTTAVHDEAVKAAEKAEADARQRAEEARLKAFEEQRQADAVKAAQEKQRRTRIEVEHRRAEVQRQKQEEAYHQEVNRRRIQPDLAPKREKCVTLATGERVCGEDR